MARCDTTWLRTASLDHKHVMYKPTESGAPLLLLPSMLRVGVLRALPETRAPLARTFATQSGRKDNEGRRGRDLTRRRRVRPEIKGYDAWRQSDADQYRFPPPGPGPHWVWNTPFPLNPLFVPQAPIHNHVRSLMWKFHFSKPSRWTVRALAVKFSMSVERTEAILRQKALEEELVKQVRGTAARQPGC